jgi:hypothetical protein
MMANVAKSAGGKNGWYATMQFVVFFESKICIQASSDAKDAAGSRRKGPWYWRDAHTSTDTGHAGESISLGA